MPADFRKTVAESSKKRHLCLSRMDDLAGDEPDCLIGFGLSRYDDIEAEIDKKEELATARGEKFDRDAAELEAGGMAFGAGFDTSGRFIFPNEAAALANISDEALFVGNIRYFQIWDPDTLLSINTDSRTLKDAQRLIPMLRAQQGDKA